MSAVYVPFLILVIWAASADEDLKFSLVFSNDSLNLSKIYPAYRLSIFFNALYNWIAEVSTNLNPSAVSSNLIFERPRSDAFCIKSCFSTLVSPPSRPLLIAFAYDFKISDRYFYGCK